MQIDLDELDVLLSEDNRKLWLWQVTDNRPPAPEGSMWYVCNEVKVEDDVNFLFIGSFPSPSTVGGIRGQFLHQDTREIYSEIDGGQVDVTSPSDWQDMGQRVREVVTSNDQ